MALLLPLESSRGWPPKAPADVAHAAALSTLQTPKSLQHFDIMTPKTSMPTSPSTPRRQWRRLPLSQTTSSDSDATPKASWAADNLMISTDIHRLGGVVPFPPPYSEEPPDHSFCSRREALTRVEKHREKELGKQLGRSPRAIVDADLDALPRRLRIQMLEGLLGAQDEQAKTIPSHRRQIEYEPMRHASSARYRREFQARWGAEINPRYLSDRGRSHADDDVEHDDTSEDQSPDSAAQQNEMPTALALTAQSSSLISLSAQKDDMADAKMLQAPDTPLEELAYIAALAGADKHQLTVTEAARMAELAKAVEAESSKQRDFREKYLPFPVTLRRTRWSKDEEDDRSLSFQEPGALLEELRQMGEAARTNMHQISVKESARMAEIARALEVRAYKLRSNHLLQAVVLVGQGTSRLEVAARPVRGQSVSAKEPIRRAAEAMHASMHALSAALSAEALWSDQSHVANALRAIAEAGTGRQEYLDAQLARLHELFRREPKVTAPNLAKIAGALGILLLPAEGSESKVGLSARDGATPLMRAANQRFVSEFNDRLMEKLPDFLEEDFKSMGWLFPTAYLSEHQLRKLLARAAELQVGVRQESEAESPTMRHIWGFVTSKMPGLAATLPNFTRTYCDKLEHLQGRNNSM
eukprot:TRINITY_DN73062_c0_g1_i1.p1 TRINITY_DN73062_c0_g1~~TRINITY_DN73062_c0_g1_i1.p1  ORF type:complete len:643 (-),score=129.93 TRINITY_DN73062_c0_g1_i1:66-1994(-)